MVLILTNWKFQARNSIPSLPSKICSTKNSKAFTKSFVLVECVLRPALCSSRGSGWLLWQIQETPEAWTSHEHTMCKWSIAWFTLLHDQAMQWKDSKSEGIETCIAIYHTHTQTHKHTQTNKQTNTQTNKQTNKQTSKQTNKQTNKQTKKQTNKQTNKQASKQTNKQASKQANKQTNTQTHKHTNTQAHKHTNTQTHKQTNKQTSKQASKQANKQANKQASKQAIKQASKQTNTTEI